MASTSERSASASDGRKGRRRWPLRVAAAAGVLLALIGVGGAVAGLWLHSRITASLPLLDGEAALPSLSATVLVERDALGVPTIHAANRLDLARATGWLHAQDRFFQMDLMRRSAAGELAELVGAAAFFADRRKRAHRFRARAARKLEELDPGDKAILAAYAEGVNAGLAALRAAPPEYLLLRVEPAPWRPEDSVLVLMSMFIVLQGDNGRRESFLGLMHDRMPRGLFEFLVSAGTEWDAPLVGGPLPAPPIPGPESLDLREERSGETARRRPGESEAAPPAVPGSNSWAVAGTHTADGGALLANDMHLPLSLPNTWYRASFEWTDDGEPAREWRATGITLPGTPALVGGSNGRVAWGFTNSYGDWVDLVVLEADPEAPDRYRTPDGYRRFERHTETIRVRGGEPKSLDVLDTIWGPVIDRDHLDRPRALRWVAHDGAAVNFELLGLERAASVDEALAVARRSGIPAQNFVVADAGGRIGWTLIGMLPRRFGHDGLLPSSWADGDRGWDGWLEPEEHPAVVDPDSGRLWTANNRVVDEAGLRLIGRGGCDLGARASQIRDSLFSVERATVAEMLAIQLDDRALFLERWRDLLLRTLTPEALAERPDRAELREVVERNWTGRASIDSAGYRLVRAFRSFLAEQVFDAIVDPLVNGESVIEHMDYLHAVPQWEGPLWRLVEERPLHLLDPRHESWEEQLLAAADAVSDHFAERYGPGLAQRTWGERNVTRVGHPLSGALPRLSGWLDLEPRPLPGDSNMPRVQSPGFGASERFAVSPGREEQGYFHMPGGQCGHPLSPFYRAGHEAWVSGEPTPFLPGPPEHRLTLRP
jgi:penicillin amidase